MENGNPSYSGEIINADAAFTGNASGSGCFRDQYIEVKNTDSISSTNCTIMFSQQKTGTTPGVIFSNLEGAGPSGFELGISAANMFYYKNYIDNRPTYQTLDNYPADKNLYAFTRTSQGAGKLFRLDFSNPEERPLIYQFPNVNNSSDDDNDGAGDSIKYYNFESEEFLVPEYTISNGPTWRLGSG